jgi:tRNA pseudouridine32 synthase/23S rRNA pseudouridine746 synthase
MFIPFDQDWQKQALPAAFTFPFYYDVHPLARHAASLLMQRLETEEFGHDFGLGRQERNGAIGKMLGVLVVKNREGQLGYLAAFSGKLGNSNEHAGFVPPVFDLLHAQSFFRREEIEINELTIQLAQLEKLPDYAVLKQQLDRVSHDWAQRLEQERQRQKQAKINRDQQRQEASLNGLLNEELLAKLNLASMNESRELKRLKVSAKEEIEKARLEVEHWESKLEQLKIQRAAHSADLQRRIFEKYTFLNARKEEINVLDLFAGSPPAGAGECAAPKLLQFAYLNDFQPICMAEFWWGMSPDSEIRVHGQFYPSCKSKCEPILGHMLQGLSVDENPITAIHPPKPLDIIFEDEWIVAVNKAPEYLSVPGKSPLPNTLDDLKKYFPNADGPLLVHRLDMSTSGIMLAAKTKLMHQRLQRQFVLRKVQKEYVAILEGELSVQEGEIKLPLRVDLEDRPRQLVCYEHGSFAHTTFKVVAVENGHTRILFYPHTGRTHQLRVHAAHYLGLNSPIKGDDLYGNKAERLHLHAAKLGFFHPQTNEWMELNCSPTF